jgi:hypothetical protein
MTCYIRLIQVNEAQNGPVTGSPTGSDLITVINHFQFFGSPPLAFAIIALLLLRLPRLSLSLSLSLALSDKEEEDSHTHTQTEMSGHDSKYFSTTKKGEIPELKEELNSQYKVHLSLSPSLSFSTCICVSNVWSSDLDPFRF